MGVICDYLTRGEYYDEDEKRNRKYRNKYFFTLTILDEMYPTKTFSKWISLKVAPRRIKKYYINKGIHQAIKVLGVKQSLKMYAFYKKNKNFLKKFLKSPKYAINKGVQAYCLDFFIVKIIKFNKKNQKNECKNSRKTYIGVGKKYNVLFPHCIFVFVER